MSCTVAYLGGASSCKSLLKNMIGGVIQETGNTWTEANLTALTAWHTVIADDDSTVRNALPVPFLYFQNTTDEPEILTAPGSGKKSKGSDPIPSGIVYLDMNIEEYLQYHGYKGQSFEFFPFFEDGTFWATKKSDGTFKGLRVSIDTNAGLPPEDKNNSFPVYMFFDSYAEFESLYVAKDLNFGIDDLLNYVPVALDMYITTAYTGGDVVLQINKVGSGDAYTGLVVGDFEVMKSNATPTVVCTAVSDDGLGAYTLTIKKDNDGTPANLGASDYAIIQVHDDDGTYFTYISNALRVQGGA